MSDAGGHVPDSPVGQEATEALARGIAAAYREAFEPEWHLVAARESLDAAYPLIRAQVCQELAEKLRVEFTLLTGEEAAEFVESYGKATDE